MNRPETNRRQHAPVPGLMGRALAWAYGREIARRNRKFDARQGVVELDRPVISVGNLSVGGTGKTPMVQRVVEWLGAGGFDPAIAMRGYAAPRGGASDEAIVYTQRLAGVPLVARPNRVEGLIELFATARGRRVDCVVLDDGFQHRKILRQCDIVLVDATRSCFDDALLPAGLLREPVSSLARADVMVLTHANRVASSVLTQLREKLKAANPRALRVACVHRWAALLDQDGQEHALQTLQGKRVFACCAIGNPEHFLATCREVAGRTGGGGGMDAMVLRDHDPFDDTTVERLITKLRDHASHALLVSEKDWAKLSRVDRRRWPVPVYRPRLELEFVDGEQAFRERVLEIAREGQSLRSLMDLPEVGDDEPEAREASPG
jgi:tetraacyldisaccharide 4'-kinase